MRGWGYDQRPTCFTNQADWEWWLKYRAGAPSPCTDCSQCHQAKMLAEGRCDRPDAIFTVEDGELIGVVVESRGYVPALHRQPYSNELVQRLEKSLEPKAIPVTVKDVVRRDIEAWIRRSRNG